MRSGRVGTTIPDYLPKGGFARGSLEKEDGNANSKKRDLPRRHGGHGEKRGGERRREEERGGEEPRKTRHTRKVPPWFDSFLPAL
jgi:hypothetical protein